jgi:hypothetical protein
LLGSWHLGCEGFKLIVFGLAPQVPNEACAFVALTATGALVVGENHILSLSS